ncbi:cytochrome c peroxidase [Flavobacterium sp. DGU11]|uniref:Cytochrome c peroxidase n=1 Tax=Flavobacterium arundinis TaxID=3139143 RepID=A0ABU9HVK2_9FLAO
MHTSLLRSIACLLAGIVFCSCSTDDAVAYQPIVDLPPHFPALRDSQENPLTKEGIALGRKLFFDTRLSGTNTVSCATCHKPELAFSDGAALSTSGVSGHPLLRNAPALINLAWADNGLFWDGGSTNLESQAFAPMAHVDEMHQDLNELIDELNADPLYPSMFAAAFADEVTQAGIVKALAQYQRTLISGNSKYDRYLLGQEQLSPLESQGLAIAENLCFSCHSGVLLTDNSYHNNGLDSDFSDTSHEGMFQGRYRVTYNPSDLGKYKTPTLRNIALTGPYMHDGRFDTLEEVITFYATGVNESPTLDPLLHRNGGQGFGISTQEREALAAFLRTLTDEDFINVPH